jgi:hypothetical protein
MASSRFALAAIFRPSEAIFHRMSNGRGRGRDQSGGVHDRIRSYFKF